MDDDEELKEQLYNVAGELYDDQFALIVIGDAEQCDGNRVEISAAGAAIIPEGCSPSMLTTAIVQLMLEEPMVADIIKSAVGQYEEKMLPPKICLN